MAQRARTDPQFKLRIPPELKDRIQAKADESGRSLTAEILKTLEDRYPQPKTAADIVEGFIAELSIIEPSLREEAISLLTSDDMARRISTFAEAKSYADKESNSRFPWEDE